MALQSIVVSFLNCGKRVASSLENFLLFGANLEEHSESMRNFISKLISDTVTQSI